jgi:hypothetical protein
MACFHLQIWQKSHLSGIRGILKRTFSPILVKSTNMCSFPREKLANILGKQENLKIFVLEIILFWNLSYGYDLIMNIKLSVQMFCFFI